MSENLRLGFLGGGKMATALARGFLKAGLVEPAGILASDPVAASRDSFASSTGARAAASNTEVAQFARVLILAVKPDQVRPVLTEIAPHFSHAHLLMSIAAGVAIGPMEELLPARSRVIRVMPNTPAMVGASATAFSHGQFTNDEDVDLARRLFSAVGIAIEVKETLLDAVTGLSGSGPAYACVVMEALSDGGVAAGLPRDIALQLAAQTLLGSARMVLETGLHPGTLKDQVASPGGTTIDGLHELEKGGVRAALINAVRAAAEKSKRLGQK